ncbi:unnamed protein product [Choristocarpus tenellus]
MENGACLRSVDCKHGVYTSMVNTIHVDETWFYLMTDEERDRVFPHEDDSDLPGSPTVQHKSHIPQTTIIAAYAPPDSAHSFDGKLGVSCVCVPKTAGRTRKNHKKGDAYEQGLYFRPFVVQEMVHGGFTACNQDQDALVAREACCRSARRLPTPTRARATQKSWQEQGGLKGGRLGL